MNFGEVIYMLQARKCIGRRGWNDRDMYIYMEEFSGFMPCIILKTNQNDLQPGWLPSHADIFAEDWYEVCFPE